MDSLDSLDLGASLSRALGPKTAKAFESAFSFETVGDLLWHLPRRIARRGDLTPLPGLPQGEHATVVAQVLDVRDRKMQSRRGGVLEVRITDGTGIMSLTFFNQGWRANELVAGKRGVFAGKVGEYRGMQQLTHPEYELFEDDDVPEGVDADALANIRAKDWADTLVPIYPATSKLPSWTIQKSIQMILDVLEPVSDPIPGDVLREEGVCAMDRAIRWAHQPTSMGEWKQSLESLRFREALHLQLALLDRRRREAALPTSPWPRVEGGLLDAFDAAMPFTLTGDQVEVGETLESELTSVVPMHRLLQGEVGSGKTLVALRAMLQVADGGGQSALLAPTEVLATQHFRSIRDLLGSELGAKVRPVLLTGQMPLAERKKALLSAAVGEALVIVGTHALMSDKTGFHDLGFVVVDEQHRFGVEQRDTLRRKGKTPPHLLVMTATPIPRTVALTAFGDLEVSTIRELPPGRQGIVTHAVSLTDHPAWGDRAWERAAEEVRSGRQVYVVCPSIEPAEVAVESELSASDPAGSAPPRVLQSVLATVAELRARPSLAGVRVEALTGAMPGPEKEAVMMAFAAGEIGVLVATTVIEVGVNVPNATLMIVRDADRFGISQLHQLRGRVGRGEHPGLCLLLSPAEEGSIARERVDAVAATTDGFDLAEVDLQLRREGDILGVAQSGGRSSLKLLRVAEHGDLIAHSREVAGALLDADPELQHAPGLREIIEQENRSGVLENLGKS